MIQVHFYLDRKLVAVKSINVPFASEHKAVIEQWAKQGRIYNGAFNHIELRKEIDRKNL
jgi:hypothetical protein